MEGHTPHHASHTPHARTPPTTGIPRPHTPSPHTTKNGGMLASIGGGRLTIPHTLHAPNTPCIPPHTHHAKHPHTVTARTIHVSTLTIGITSVVRARLRVVRLVVVRRVALKPSGAGRAVNVLCVSSCSASAKKMGRNYYKHRTEKQHSMLYLHLLLLHLLHLLP